MSKSSRCKTIFFQTLFAVVLICIIVVLVCDALFLVLQIDKSFRDRAAALEAVAGTGFITIQDTTTYKTIPQADLHTYNEARKMKFERLQELDAHNYFDNYFQIDEIDEIDEVDEVDEMAIQIYSKLSNYSDEIVEDYGDLLYDYTEYLDNDYDDYAYDDDNNSDKTVLANTNSTSLSNASDTNKYRIFAMFGKFFFSK